MTLKVPLGPRQIAAANRIYEQLPQWCLADRALAELADALPGFQDAPCLAKAATLNALYSTRVFALTAVASHASRILTKRDLEHAGPELVEELAHVQDPPRRLRSFASKFCHFFVASERFPIFDKYADEITSLHLGKSRLGDKEHSYASFVDNFRLLKSLSGFGGPNRELDRYL